MTAITGWEPLTDLPWGNVMAASDAEHVLEVRWALRHGRPDTISRRWTTSGHPIRRKQHDLEDGIVRGMRADIERALKRRASWMAGFAPAEAERLREITARSRGPVPRREGYSADLLDEVADEYKRARAAGEHPVQAVNLALNHRGYDSQRIRRILARCRKTGRL